MNNTQNIIITILAVILIILVGYGAYTMVGGGNEEPLEDFVATVNGVKIPKSDYDLRLKNAIEDYRSQGFDVESPDILSQIEAKVLDTLINDEVLKQAVNNAGVSATAEDVDTEYQALLGQAGTPEAFAEQLKTAGLTEEELRANILLQLSAQKFLSQNIDIAGFTASDEEILALYDSVASTGQELLPLDEIHDQVSEQVIANKRQEAINTFVLALREKADVVIVDDNFDKSPEGTDKTEETEDSADSPEDTTTDISDDAPAETE